MRKYNGQTKHIQIEFSKQTIFTELDICPLKHSSKDILITG